MEKFTPLARNFTLPPGLTGWTNFTSGHVHTHMCVFSASILCGQGHELRSYCSISFYVRVQNSRQMWPLKSNVPHSRCSKYRDTTLKANHISSCSFRAFPLNVNQMLQGCSFFASTTHGSPNRPLPNQSPPHIPKRYFIFLLHASSNCQAVHQIKSI